jgi:hypothetical protein
MNRTLEQNCGANCDNQTPRTASKFQDDRQYLVILCAVKSIKSQCPSLETVLPSAAAAGETKRKREPRPLGIHAHRLPARFIPNVEVRS